MLHEMLQMPRSIRTVGLQVQGTTRSVVALAFLPYLSGSTILHVNPPQLLHRPTFVSKQAHVRLLEAIAARYGH